VTGRVFPESRPTLRDAVEKMRRQLIIGVLSYLAMTSCLFAQTATGVIRGTVQDPRRDPR
jgi:hypothetical protein